jgi:hypothetical protein
MSEGFSTDYDHGCRYGPSGLPSCLAGTRDERWWCKACSDHALIRWLVETVHYPFDFSFSTPPPVDHHAIADHWNAWDGWDITAEEAYACVAEEAGLHDCATCSDCLHDGNKCCGCYDNSCCQTTVIAPDGCPRGCVNVARKQCPVHRPRTVTAPEGGDQS